MKKKIIPVVIAIVLIIVVFAVSFGKQILDKYSYSKEKYDMTVYFENKSDSDIAIILQDTFMQDRAFLYNGIYYVTKEFSDTYFNDRFFWDKTENLLIYTFPEEIVACRIDSDVVLNASGEKNLGYIPVKSNGDDIIIALDYLKDYANFSYEAFTDPGRIQIYTEWPEKTVATVKKDTAVRHRGGVKAEILKEVKAGDSLIVIEQMEEWSKVKTNDGIIGFVENKRLSNIMPEQPIPVNSYVPPVYSDLCRDYKINMGWMVVASASGNDTFAEVYNSNSGMNVISPTWFGLTDSDGNYESFATKTLVDKVHNMGMEIWPTFGNIDHSSEVDMNQVLNGLSNRQRLINNLVAEALDLGIDGINVDIEMLPVEAGKAYSEFIRELSVACRKNNLVLSIDNYVPIGNTEYYDRKTQGEVADYVVIMGYDEHYAGSAEAGSVASIGYVETGIANTLKDVPARKIINGIPLYTRVWDTDGADVTSRAFDMPSANEWIGNHGVALSWDEGTCQNYGEYTSDGVLHQIWMEDAESIRVKLNVMKTYDIAGAAFWRMGYETSDIWEVVGEYMNN